MESKKLKGKFILFTASLALVLGIIAIASAIKGNKPDRQYDVVFLGDSMFGLIKDETSIPSLVSAKTGLTVFNGAISGTSLTDSLDYDNYGDTTNAFNGVSICNAIAIRDFSMQNAANKNGILKGETDAIFDGLSRIDFKKTKFLVLCYGFNDYHAGVPITDDKDDRFCITGAVKTIVKALKTAYPKLTVVFVTPTYSVYTENGENVSCLDKDFGGSTLNNYVAGILNTAQKEHAAGCDIFNEFYDTSVDCLTYTVDGLHPNENGRKMISDKIAELLGALR